MNILFGQSKIVHFIGIGGCGMSGLAELLLKKSFKVQGSDSEQNIYTQRLKSLGVIIFYGHDKNNLCKANVVVVSTAIKQNNIQIIEARAKNIPIIHRSEMLSQIIRGHVSLTISGTHGKTTTTSLLGWLLDCADFDPTIINGGIMNEYNSNIRQGKSKWAVVQADESDGSFNRIPSSIVIVTNIDLDHMQYHGTIQSLYKSFHNYVKNIPFYGFGVLCIDNPYVLKLSQQINQRRIITYGFNAQANIYAKNLKFQQNGVIFDIIMGESIIKDVFLSLFGEHNIRNALAVFAISKQLGISLEIVRKAFRNFKGTKRRFTQLTNIHGVRVIDDYAHHPEEIKAVVAATKKTVKGKIYAVVQPPQKPTRFAYLFSLYEKCFDGCQQVLIPLGPIDQHNRTCKDLINNISQKYGIFSCQFEDPLLLADLLIPYLQPGDIVLCMGFGKITLWAHNLAKDLEKKYNPHLRKVLQNISPTAKLLADTRQIKPGDIFIAYPVGRGKLLVDNRIHISKALNQGVSYVFYQPNNYLEICDWQSSINDKCIPVENLSSKAGFIISEWYNKPSETLKVIGVTGTNGKTSITQWLSEILNGGVIGTLGYGFPNHLKATGYTTPQAPHLQSILYQFKQQNAEYVAMEVSSYGLEQERVNGTKFQCAIFTNLTRDHLDYHKDMQDYGQAKAKLFKQFRPKKVVINIDDPFGKDLFMSIFAPKIVCLYAIKQESFAGLQKYKITNKIYYKQYIFKKYYYECMIVINDQIYPIDIHLLGEFNLSNILAVLVTLIVQGIDIPDALSKISQLRPVKGRMQIINVNNPQSPLMIVDYAHTPDALLKVLETLKTIAKDRRGEIYLVFGCGGDRDEGKRSIMGKIAEENAHHVIITNDNPRSENPQKIIQMITKDMNLSKSIEIIFDRAEAIHRAVHKAKKQDIIIVTGKGHETYQQINENKFHFSDLQNLREAINKMF